MKLYEFGICLKWFWECGGSGWEYGRSKIDFELIIVEVGCGVYGGLLCYLFYVFICL